jgi:hypothetical protein
MGGNGKQGIMADLQRCQIDGAAGKGKYCICAGCKRVDICGYCQPCIGQALTPCNYKKADQNGSDDPGKKS